MSKFEPTLLPFNKNDDNVNIVYEKINLNKSVVDDLCKDNDLDSDLLKSKILSFKFKSLIFVML